MKFAKIWAMVPQPLYNAIHDKGLFRGGQIDSLVALLIAKYLVSEYGYTLKDLEMEDY